VPKPRAGMAGRGGNDLLGFSMVLRRIGRLGPWSRFLAAGSRPPAVWTRLREIAKVPFTPF